MYGGWQRALRTVSVELRYRNYGHMLSPLHTDKLFDGSAAKMLTSKQTAPERIQDGTKRTKLQEAEEDNTIMAATVSRVPFLRVKKLTEFANLPIRGSPLAAGYDLCSAYDVVVPARGKALIKTDLAIAVPEDCYGRIAPRSSLAWKHHMDVGAGVIDADYRGNVGVVLFNHADSDYKVERGDRVAQLILERIYTPEIEEVDDLDNTQRGAGGYGSTGKN